MELIIFLILFPFLAAAILAVVKNNNLRKAVTYISSIAIIAVTAVFSVQWFLKGEVLTFFEDVATINMIMLVAEFFIMCLIIFLSFKYKKYFVALLSAAQTLLIAWLELFGHHSEAVQTHIFIDQLTIIMMLIVAVVGCLICVYAAGYMTDYHHHHKEVKDRRCFFFALLFVFLGAMFGLVMASNLIWMYFFWEITSLVSFLLIGYTKTEEAINNSFRALWMNLLGGLGFAVGIVYASLELGISNLQDLVASGEAAVIIPVILLAFAGLTKSAQFPFSKWLLGAMVAPTPTSALLHSATMVKAGVYLLLRLGPAMAGNYAGTMVSLIGGFTFFVASVFAITHTDAKKVLAYSTISNLGLITACAGIGVSETIWAGIMLVIFHAVSKSLLFQTVGAVENTTGSRDIENMHGLIRTYPMLTAALVIGIAGMFLAPFGMLISKWAALKAFVDAGSVILIMLVAFGSATTLFYWTKWLGKILAFSGKMKVQKNQTSGDQWVSLFIHAVLMVVICALFPLVSKYAILPLLTATFGAGVTEVLSGSSVVIVIIMLFAVFVVPFFCYIFSRHAKIKHDLPYMSGINVDDSRMFIDSFGEGKKLYLANWYMADMFGEEKWWKPSILLATAMILICMVIAIGGVI